MSVEQSLFTALQSIVLALGIIVLGAILSKWLLIRGSVRAEFKEYIFRLVTGSHQATNVMNKMKEWATVATTDGVLGLIGVPQTEENEVAAKGLQMVLTGKESDEIRQSLDEDVQAATLSVQSAAKKVTICTCITLFFVFMSIVLGVLLYLHEDATDQLRMLGLYTLAMSVCYALMLVLPIWLLLVKGLKKIAVQLKVECELVVTGLSMIAEGETAEQIVSKLKIVIDETS